MSVTQPKEQPKIPEGLPPPGYVDKRSGAACWHVAPGVNLWWSPNRGCRPSWYMDLSKTMDLAEEQARAMMLQTEEMRAWLAGGDMDLPVNYEINKETD